MQLTDSLAVLSGVGPKRLSALNQLGLVTIADLLYYFPFRYEDLKVKQLNEISDQEKVTLKGVIASEPVLTRFGRSKSRLSVRLLIEQDLVIVTFFNQPYLKEKFQTGDETAIYGKWDANHKRLTGMKVLAVQNDKTPSFAGIYSVNQGIKQATLMKLIEEAYQSYHGLVIERIPEAIRQRYQLLNEQQIIYGMHFPKTFEQAKLARRSAIFREFFLYQLQLQSIKQRHQQVENGLVLAYDNQALKAFIETLPFELTTAQKKVVNEICQDLKAPTHMNRLLQGDVGSGKTIVAAIALFAAVTAGYQGALMVPTEILATQHFEKLTALFEPLNVTVGLLTGSLTAKNQQATRQLIENGHYNIVVGTHALIQEHVTFKKLGFVVIDEQHRFGVTQRQRLKQKGINPDVLSMTATPIPRTLAITTYGEMDVSTIDELPKGRQGIETIWLHSHQTQKALKLVQETLEQGSQAFAITPLISESEQMDLKNAEALYEKLAAYFEPHYHVALLHGKLKEAEKNQIMNDFSANKVRILVSTTVVEVGVDVPNATMMLIFDANRFGLAQLHQLRGRVGRGDKPAKCLLIADPKNQQGIDRMTIMTQTNNGFILAEKDLELRGSGEIFGQKQSGLPQFAVGDPVGDFTILQVAQKEVSQLLKQDQQLLKEPALQAYLNEQNQKQGDFD